MGSKKNMSSKKKGTYIFFGPNIVQKKVWLQKLDFQKKGTHTLSGQHSAKKSMGSKKSMSSKKKELILFSGRTLRQKKYGFQKKSVNSKKKGTHT